MKVEVTIRFDNEIEAAEYLLRPASPPVEHAPAVTVEATEAPAPTPAPVVAAPVESDSADLDVNGVPWDKRIHANTKSKNKDGTWRYMRGLDDTIKNAVEAEIKASVAPTPAVETPVTPVAAAAPAAPLPPIPTPAPAAAAAPVAPPVPQPDPDGTDDDVDDVIDATPADVVEAVSTMVMDGLIEMTELTQICADLGIKNIADLKGHPEKTASAVMLLRSMGKEI